MMMVIPDILSSMAQMWLLKITEKTVKLIDDGYSSYSIQHGEDVTAKNYRENCSGNWWWYVIPDILSSTAQMWLLKITEKTAQAIDYGNSRYIPSSMAQMWLLKNTEKTVQVIVDGM